MERVFHQVESESEYSGKFITSHINLEDNPAITRRHNVRYVPVLIFRDSSGKEIAQKIGFMPLNKLIEVFRSSGVEI